MCKASKLHLIIDGNYFFHRSLAMYHSPDEQAGEAKLSSEDDQAFYARKVIIDTCSAIRNLGSVNLSSVIMTIDSRSWRKDVEIEENAGYKSNRIAKSTINWDGFYTVMKEVTKIFSENGIFISRVKRAEGDDLMYLYSNEFIKRGEDTIILTGDKDMWQVIKDDNRNFVAIYTSNGRYNKVVITQNILNEMEKESVSINSMILESGNMDNVKNLASFSSSGIERITIDPIQHAFEKIFPGDGGDGVPPVYTWVTETKGGKKRYNNLTSKRTQPIWDLMVSKYTGMDRIYRLPDEVDFCYSVVNEVSKGQLKTEMTKEKFKEKIQRNIILMVLDKEVIPHDIQKLFQEEFEHTISKVENTMRNFNMNNYYIDKLIPGTKFDGRGTQQKTDYFNDVKFDEGDFFNDENDKMTL